MGNHQELDRPGRRRPRPAPASGSGRCPLPEDYRKLIDSDGGRHQEHQPGPLTGALTAGLFLREFVGEIPWVHLDIAGPARSDEDDGYLQKGGTGFGVRTLVEAVTSFRRP